MTNNNYLSLVSPQIMSAIEHKRQTFYSFSQYHLPYSSKKRKQLQQDAARHSVEVELVGYDTKTSRGRRNKSRTRKENEKNLLNALDWGFANYSPVLTDEFIIGIGSRIEPRMNYDGYRDCEARPNGGWHFYTSPEKIDLEMNCFLFQNNALDSPVEKAIHTHFNIARVHPFGDGNGRVARLVQNIVLEKEGYLPVTISLDERTRYIKLIEAATESYNKVLRDSREDPNSKYSELIRTLSKPAITLKEGLHCRELSLQANLAHNTPEKTQFYDFIAQKVLDTLTAEVETIKSKNSSGIFSSRRIKTHLCLL